VTRRRFRVTDLLRSLRLLAALRAAIFRPRKLEPTGRTFALATWVAMLAWLVAPATASEQAAAAKAGAHAAATPLLGTDWLLVQVGVTPAQREAPGRSRAAHIVLRSEGDRYEGSSGCNRIFGSFRLDGEALSLAPVASTKMACPGPLMQQEKKLIAALDATTRYRTSGHVLQLFAGEKLLARFESHPPAKGQ